VWPPVGGTFQFQIFIQASSPEIWSTTISGGEEVLAGKWGGLFLGYLLGKIIGGVIAIISFRPGGWMQQSAVPRCAMLSVGSTGVTSSEAARVHIACPRCGGRVAMLAIRTMPTWTPPKTPANDNLITLFVKDKG
jgi:hypothetical protein